MDAMRAERQVDVVADELFFPEGPRWHDGRLWFSDFYDRRVHTVAPDGTRAVVCEVPGQPSGLGFTPGGELLICSMKDQRLLCLREHELVEVVDLSAWMGGDANDLFVDPAGRAYVGNYGFDPLTDDVRPTALLRIDPNGSVTVAAEDLVFPNGMVLTQDGTLLIAETFAYRISAFDVAPDGGLSNRRIWVRFGAEPARDFPQILANDAIAPDGMCLDAEDAVWVADACGRGAHRLREGEVVESVDLGDGQTAFAVALGGDDGRTLFLCAGPSIGAADPTSGRYGSVLATRVEVPGAAWR